MAPEQACSSWGSIDPRTDIYGIGAVLFTLVTDRPPFIGSSVPEILAQVISTIPAISPRTLNPTLSRELSQLCQICLSKTLADRYQSTHELRSALESVITHHS